jgi:hypothetical protein
MLHDTRTFYLSNNINAPKLATVRRTLQTGQQESFSFRVNSYQSPGWNVNVLFFAGTDHGSIELINVVDSPKNGTMDGIDSIHRDIFRGDLPALRNSSPRPIYVGVDIYGSDDPNHRRPHGMQLVFKPGQVIPISSQPDTVELVFNAVELQKSSLYPPYWR